MNEKATVHPNVILRKHFGLAQCKLRDRRISEIILRACIERYEILHFVQNDRKRIACGDTKVTEQLLKAIKGSQDSK